jgi:hypothetical protein
MIDSGEDEELPDELNLSQEDLDTYWNIWALWRATDRRFLPSQLMAEPERPLLVMLELDGAYAMIERQEAKRKSKSNKDFD